MYEEQRPHSGAQFKPVVTYAYIAICAVIFLAETLMGGSTRITVLIRMGAKVNELILAGQWWRLVTPMFLHVGIQHIAFNLIALYIWGRQVEPLMGGWRYAAVLVISGIGGAGMSFAFNNAISAGASGAIFGLFGALLMFRKRYRYAFDRVFGAQVLVIVGINLVMGFLGSGVDNWGHIGGLASGFLCAEALGLKRENRPWHIRALALLGLLLFLGACLLWGARSLFT